jgi:hypothetical protein
MPHPQNLTIPNAFYREVLRDESADPLHRIHAASALLRYSAADIDEAGEFLRGVLISDTDIFTRFQVAQILLGDA